MNFREGASKTIVMLQCSQCSDQESWLDYTDIQAMLLSEGITLYVVGEKSIELRQGSVQSSTKSRGLVSLDTRTVFRAKDFMQPELEGQIDLRPFVSVPKDECVSLSLESRGAYFSTVDDTETIFETTSKHVSKSWKSLLARRITLGAEPPRCQHCDCIADSDGLHAKTVCRPCRSWKPTYYNNDDH